ncbi:insecticidal delta-endotoxin Cry8Ea1 family protein [Bacillus toyonensis]|uniref:insecticidal delta-endotoxin Cry8Ea1 family protein n=1 Tax=Bacillus toyonensis TaxID=155322 RepID=UPI000CD7E3C5|nr:insecticidal delta-endotoxin Cry8Ea1 family protein [Bacillus toyonensis]MED3539380.1 insecticidal delta-endotoxin Cry8Ea1 family protein [Bacillus toyonensis]MEE2018659.1 insecticidal delta-endotoxin Cry8Ea1 family protein [Bacillus toyonensis]
MNSYQNKNEYEILDASQNNSTMSNRYPRYPLANDPQASMQNTNYKDWLNMCDSNTQFVGDISTYSSPEAALSVRDAVLTGINTAGTILSNLGVPFASQSFGMIGRIIGILWPGPDPFAALMVLVEELINQRINDEIRNHALLELAGLKGIMDLYRTRWRAWDLNKDNPETREAVRAQYRTADNFFIQNMPKFGREDHGVLLLPVYAQAANMHLILLRDAYVFGTGWGLGPGEVRDNYTRLQEKIREYKDHCVTFYNQGLNRFNRSNAQDWVSFNRFRTDMTLTVLDLAILFPNYDPRIYPSAVKTELTREIYTDPVGFTGVLGSGGRTYPWYNPNDTSFATMENSARRRPSFTTWLNRIRIFTGHIGNFSAAGNVWGGHELFERSNNGSEIIQRFGNTNTSYTPVRNWDFTNQNRTVFSIASTARVLLAGSEGNAHRPSQYGVSRVDMHTAIGGNTSGGQFIYEVPNVHSSQNILSELPGENQQRPDARNHSHILSYISNFDAKRGGTVGNVRLLTYGWTHTSMDRNNRLERDRITQIDAVKGWGGVTGSVIPGPTGGSLVTIPSNPWSVSLRVQAPQIQTNYRIRLRFACVWPGAHHMWVTYGGISHPVQLCNNPSSGRPSNNLLESDFGYVVVPGTFSPSINPEIRFSAISNAPVLDKIEFIPLDIYNEHFVEERAKTINDLFIN